jgi:hypothetical protein
MADGTFRQVALALETGRFLISRHAVIEAAKEGVEIGPIRRATMEGLIVEDYPHDERGPMCLVLGRLETGEPLHLLWGFDEPTGQAILVTVYRPDPALWERDWKTRTRKRGHTT